MRAVVGRNVRGDGLQGILPGDVEVPGYAQGSQHVGSIVGAHQLRLQDGVLEAEFQERIGLCLYALAGVENGFQAPLSQHFLQHGVIGVGEGHAAVLLEIVVEEAFGVFDALIAAEAQQVPLSHVGDKPQVGLGHGQQGFEVFRMAGAHFHDGYLGPRMNAQHRERHANLVVQVALRGADAVGGAQGPLDKLLGGGFAVGAGKADNGNPELAAVIGGQFLQGFQALISGHHIGCAFFPGLVHKGIAVKILPLEGEEKLVFAKGACIGGNACTVQVDVVEFFYFHEILHFVQNDRGCSE